MEAPYPYQYEIVYALLRERLTAHELSCMWPFRKFGEYNANPTLAMVNRMRPMIARGWIELIPEDPASGIYQATARAREALCW